MSGGSDTVALLFLLFGAFGLWLEFAFPRFAAAMPWAQWANGAMRSGRFSRVVGCLLCIAIGLGLAGVIPEAWSGWLGGGFVMAFLYGLARDAVAAEAREAKSNRAEAAGRRLVGKEQARAGSGRRQPKRRRRKN